MRAYEYQVLRYLPDRIGGEFANLGLVLFQPETQFLRAGFISSTGRVTNFFPGMDGRYLQRQLRHLQGMLDGYADNLGPLSRERMSDLKTITGKFLVTDDTSIQFSEVRSGLDDDMNTAFDELYDRIIDNYRPGQFDNRVRNDHEVWQKLYRPLFEKRGIAGRLQRHQVATENDTIDFSYAWKNEIWHCYEPVTFDLKKPDSVKNKVYKWVGLLDELRTANETLEVQLMTALPTDDPEMLAFILEKLDQKVFGSAKVSIVRQQKAEEFVSQVQDKLSEHDQQ